MVQYRRNLVPGGTFFFTVNLRQRKSRLLVEYVDSLREATHKVRVRQPFEIVAAVVLPDHLHAIWSLPEGDENFALRWRLIKTAFTKALRAASEKQERPWQDRYWEHTIRDDVDLQRHVDYIHWNPVKHGHAQRASDWPHSSIHRYIRAGHLTRNWACDEPTGDFGEA